MSDEGKTTIRPDTSTYVKSGQSLHCGDEVAQALDGATLDEVYAVAKEMGIDKDYSGHNAGQQRMFLGNAIRGAISKGRKAAAKAIAAAKDQEERQKLEGAPDPLEIFTGLATVKAIAKSVAARKAAEEKAKKEADAKRAKAAEAA